jgi:hypothetical protein
MDEPLLLMILIDENSGERILAGFSKEFKKQTAMRDFDAPAPPL